MAVGRRAGDSHSSGIAPWRRRSLCSSELLVALFVTAEPAAGLWNASQGTQIPFADALAVAAHVNVAINQVFRGKCSARWPLKACPARRTGEVCFPQFRTFPARPRRRFSSTLPLSWPQAGTDEAVIEASANGTASPPSAGGFIGKARHLTRCATRDIGSLSYFQRLGNDAEHQANIPL